MAEHGNADFAVQHAHELLAGKRCDLPGEAGQQY